MNRHDIVIIGSSPNALAAAARLAQAGLRVVVLETRTSAGGPVATETFAPGFRADTGVTSVGLDPEICRELGLSLGTVRRDSITALGASVLTLRSMPELPASFAQAVELLQAIHHTTPPDVPVASPRDGSGLAEVAARLGGLAPRAMHEVLRLSFISARDYLEENVDSELLRGLLAGIAVRGASVGPFAAGTLYGLLHHLALDDALFRSTAQGGVQKIAQALAEAAQNQGAELRTGVAGPISVELENGIARGARLGDGERVLGELVVSDYDARATLARMVSPSELEPEANRALRHLKYRGSVARVHLALSGLPRFERVDPGALSGTLVVAPSIAGLERAWDQAKRGAASSKPYVEATIPSLTDPSFAPEGQHVLDAWVQFVPYRSAGARDVVAAVLEQLAPHAPNLADLVQHYQVSLPEDLEARFGLTEGHLWAGEISLEQTFFLRPIPGYPRYESPIPNLLLGGSAAHPAGYSGRSGWNLAGTILAAKTS